MATSGLAPGLNSCREVEARESFPRDLGKKLA
jgi:hypothetical protein